MYDLFINESGACEIKKTFSCAAITNQSNESTSLLNSTDTLFEQVHFEEGLDVKIVDCLLNEQLRLHYQPLERTADIYFTLIYCLTPNAFLVQDSSGKDVCTDDLWDTIFLCSRANFKFCILPGIPAKYISISFTKHWIEQKAVCMPSKQKDFISRLLDNNGVFYFESHNAVEKEMIDDIFKTIYLKQNQTLFLKSRIVTLIDEFISKSSQRVLLKIPKLLPNRKYELIIREVAAELTKNLFDSLPTLNEISRKFAISESTLKRNFKNTYGKSISEYYFENKMVCAKAMVSECSKTISEIAYTLGYEKVSHFISQFKKYNGCLPGALQRTLHKQIA